MSLTERYPSLLLLITILLTPMQILAESLESYEDHVYQQCQYLVNQGKVDSSMEITEQELAAAISSILSTSDCDVQSNLYKRPKKIEISDRLYALVSRFREFNDQGCYPVDFAVYLRDGRVVCKKLPETECPNSLPKEDAILYHYKAEFKNSEYSSSVPGENGVRYRYDLFDRIETGFYTPQDDQYYLHHIITEDGIRTTLECDSIGLPPFLNIHGSSIVTTEDFSLGDEVLFLGSPEQLEPEITSLVPSPIEQQINLCEAGERVVPNPVCARRQVSDQYLWAGPAEGWIQARDTLTDSHSYNYRYGGAPSEWCHSGETGSYFVQHATPIEVTHSPGA